MRAPVLTILLSIDGSTDRRTFHVDTIRFGKHPDNEICTGGHSTRVSRSHAVMSWDGEKWHMRDLNSRYGTYVNSQRVAGEGTLEVRSGDRVRIGDVELDVHY